MSSIEEAVKAVAFYFPQFHAIPENDEWWGRGFTDWHNVKKSRPLFDGHYQPRVPLNGNYYDQSKKEIVTWQIELAKRGGLHGFCHYHYWFDGVQLLEEPTNLFLRSPELDFNFCLAWANETWSRRWDGRDHHILIEQTHVPEERRWLNHFNYLIRAWTDDRHIKIDGKPVFLIYRPHRIIHLDRMLDLWREEAHRRGLKGLYFVAMKQYEFPYPELLKHFDAVVQFQPFEAIYSPDFEDKGITQNKLVQHLRILPEGVLDLLRSARWSLFHSPTFWDYDTVWRQILKEEQEGGLPTFPGAFIDWDNTPRYGKRAKIFRGANPERFEFWFRQLVNQVAARPEPNERFLFINAWNEWAESTYLEPDERYQHHYLDAVRRCLDGTGS